MGALGASPPWYVRGSTHTFYGAPAVCPGGAVRVGAAPITPTWGSPSVELRHLLAVIRRHRWTIVQAAIAVALVAGLVSAQQTPMYSASSRILLRPNDASESLYGAYGSQSLFNDPDRYVSGQIDIAKSEDVAKVAAKEVGLDTEDVEALVSVGQVGVSDIIEVSVVHSDPVLARDVANAVARAYIENRKEFAVGNLRKASTEVQTKLDELQKRIGDLDGQIGDGGLTGSQRASAPTQPGIPQATDSAGGSNPPTLNIDRGQPGGGSEAMKAARYAAAIQYESLYARQQELLVDISLKRGEAELVGAAREASAPVSPTPVRNGILGGFLGLCLGLGIAFLNEQLNDKVRSAEEIEQLSGLSVIAELPKDELSEKNPAEVAALERPQSPLAEAARALRTSVQFLGFDGGLQRIIVTSPEPGDGKSLVAANLAAVYAQAGLKTILVSADLRRPRLDTMFDLPAGAPGLSDIVAGIPTGRPASQNGNGLRAALTEASASRRTALVNALIPTSTPNLYVLPSGALPPNPAELLGSARAHSVLDDLAREADIAIIDTPPVLAVTDASALAAKADGVILVAAVGRTHRAAVRRAVTLLQGTQARVLGIVANCTEGGGSGYSYGYYTADTSAEAKKGRAKASKPAPAADDTTAKLTRGHRRQLRKLEKERAARRAQEQKAAEKAAAKAAKKNKGAPAPTAPRPPVTVGTPTGSGNGTNGTHGASNGVNGTQRPAYPPAVAPSAPTSVPTATNGNGNGTPATVPATDGFSPGPPTVRSTDIPGDEY